MWVKHYLPWALLHYYCQKQHAKSFRPIRLYGSRKARLTFPTPNSFGFVLRTCLFPTIPVQYMYSRSLPALHQQHPDSLLPYSLPYFTFVTYGFYSITHRFTLVRHSVVHISKNSPNFHRLLLFAGLTVARNPSRNSPPIFNHCQPKALVLESSQIWASSPPF